MRSLLLAMMVLSAPPAGGETEGSASEDPKKFWKPRTFSFSTEEVKAPVKPPKGRVTLGVADPKKIWKSYGGRRPTFTIAEPSGMMAPPKGRTTLSVADPKKIWKSYGGRMPTLTVAGPPPQPKRVVTNPPPRTEELKAPSEEPAAPPRWEPPRVATKRPIPPPSRAVTLKPPREKPAEEAAGIKAAELPAADKVANKEPAAGLGKEASKSYILVPNIGIVLDRLFE